MSPPGLRRPCAGTTAILTAGVGALALTACFGGLNSKIPPRQRYVLSALASPSGTAGQGGITAADGGASAATTPANSAVAAAPPAAASSIEVLLPSAAPGLAHDDIAVLRSGERLDFYNGARWAAPVPQMLQTLVIDRLREAHRFASVESDTGPFSAQYVLSLELQHFEADYDIEGAPTVRVALVYTLGRRSDRNVIGSYTARSEVRAGADRMQAVVAAFDRATAQVLSQLTVDIAPPAP